MKFYETTIPELKTFELPHFPDERGSFIKLFHAPSFLGGGCSCEIREEFFTRSKKDVIRGMHFQVPPAAHYKIVTCLAGAILDVVVDLRKGSPAYGRYVMLELSDTNFRGVAIPPGLAHGFLSLTEGAVVHYLTSHEHSPQNDGGIRWDSFGMDWPVAQPIVSAKDAALPRFLDFDSPFSLKV